MKKYVVVFLIASSVQAAQRQALHSLENAIAKGRAARAIRQAAEFAKTKNIDGSSQTARQYQIKSMPEIKQQAKNPTQSFSPQSASQKTQQLRSLADIVGSKKQYSLHNVLKANKKPTATVDSSQMLTPVDPYKDIAHIASQIESLVPENVRVNKDAFSMLKQKQNNPDGLVATENDMLINSDNAVTPIQSEVVVLTPEEQALQEVIARQEEKALLTSQAMQDAYSAQQQAYAAQMVKAEARELLEKKLEVNDQLAGPNDYSNLLFALNRENIKNQMQALDEMPLSEVEELTQGLREDIRELQRLERKALLEQEMIEQARLFEQAQDAVEAFEAQKAAERSAFEAYQNEQARLLEQAEQAVARMELSHHKKRFALPRQETVDMRPFTTLTTNQESTAYNDNDLQRNDVYTMHAPSQVTERVLKQQVTPDTPMKSSGDSLLAQNGITTPQSEQTNTASKSVTTTKQAEQEQKVVAKEATAQGEAKDTKKEQNASLHQPVKKQEQASVVQPKDTDQKQNYQEAEKKPTLPSAQSYTDYASSILQSLWNFTSGVATSTWNFTSSIATSTKNMVYGLV